MDGPQSKDQKPYVPLSKASQPLRKRGIPVYAVGVEPYTPVKDLEDLTGDKKRVFLYTTDELPKRPPQILSRWYDTWIRRWRPTGMLTVGNTLLYKNQIDFQANSHFLFLSAKVVAL